MIVLVGFMGAGKTTVGRLLAARLDVPFVDSDEVIVDRAGRPIAAIFADDGEPAFRQLEHEVIATLLRGPDAVLALGGGAVQHPVTRTLLAASPAGPAVPVVHLRVSYAEAMRRIGGDQDRPMLARPDIAQLYHDRCAVYAQVATSTVDADEGTPADLAAAIIAALAAAR
jgi:shikimate kinase